jgi:hypothetical protein
MAKLRADSTLAPLTETQRDQLYDWLLTHTYPDVQKLAARPIEEGGFGLKIHRTTLARFFTDEQQERHAEELAAIALSAPGSEIPDRIASLIGASKARFAHAAYELAKAQTDPLNFDRLERALHHIDIVSAKREELALKERELDQQRERMEEQRRQWEYSAARAALNCLPELIKITQNTATDNEEKIWAARDVCFGKPEVNLPTHNISRSERPESGNKLVEVLGTQKNTIIHTTAVTPAQIEG